VVYTLANNTVTPVPVTVGLASDTQTEITSTSLKSGDVVVTNPTSLTATTASTGASSIFGNLFRMLGVTTSGSAAGGGTAGGPPSDFGGGNPPSGSPPSGAPSGNPPSGTGG
jgi:hypothetical protein